MNYLEKKFHKDMLSIYTTAKKELNYNATRFLQLVSEKGGLKAAKQLISKEDGTIGFEVLWEMGRLDLSIEAHVLKPEYVELFTDEERKICKERLDKYGFYFNQKL
ncbi:hypothetical protein [Sedimentibacter sp. B4]|uniref:hypothetical protein n=1 Tax=Sedimentibacter sp. B4 TaxID=304766 RepID=UPI0003169575|nr:hypothetical protein [Sedimentibacter sp. B4]